MKFIEKCKKLINQHQNDRLNQKNGTLFLCPGKMPMARHYFFKGLQEQYIQEYLIDEYKWKMPKQYLELLRFSNGVDLFNVCVVVRKTTVAESLLTIFGLPLKSPYTCLEEMEPFNIWIENLDRHPRIPDWWLKVGVYYEKIDEARRDIWIDTKTEKIYACRKLEKKVVAEWENLDQCLCDIFDRNKDEMQKFYLENRKLEYLKTSPKYCLKRNEAKKLFKYLNQKLKEEECDGTLKYTKKWLRNNIKNNEEYKKIEKEIQNEGGLCDCEVLWNCYEDYDV